ncbi:MAK10-like protein [Tanacetum coccineum]
MMMAFPFTLKGKTKQWMRRLPAWSISTWDLFKNSFLKEYRPPSKIIKQIEAIRSFKQKPGEPLNCSWERQKLDFKGLIPRMTPSKGIEAIKEISGHSFSWHNEYSTKNSAGRGVDELKVVFEQIKDFEHSMKFMTEEVRMAQHRFDTPVEGRVFSIWKAFGGKTRDLGSFGEETDKTTNLHQHLSRISTQKLETASQITRDVVTTHLKTASQDLQTASECPSPQPQALGTTFEARVRDYMAAHSERMERFENAIFKQREEINGRMTEMFKLLKELMTSRAPKKVLIREVAKFPVTKNVNSISLAIGEEERSDKTDETLDNTVKPTVTEMEIPSSLRNYHKHRLNEKLIEGLVDNNRFNDSLSRARVGKVKGKIYNVLPRGPVYEAILKKKITKKEDVGGNFEIPCSIGGLKHVNALVDQGFDMNIMPYSTYMKLTNEMPAETDIRLSLASHSYIYPLGIAEDVLVEVAEHVYPVDFVILDIKENEKRPFILGTTFLTTAKATIKFDKGTITLRSGKSKISFHRIPNSLGIKKSFDQVIKAQASSIKKLEVQLGKIAETVKNRETGSLPSSTKINLRGLAHAITTRSGLNFKPPANPLVNNEDSNDAQNNDGAEDRNVVNEQEEQRKVVESYVSPIPFPGRLKKEKEKDQFRKFFKNLQQLSINIPFVEVLEQIPKKLSLRISWIHFCSNQSRTVNQANISTYRRMTVVTPPKSGSSGKVTLGCDVIAQSTRNRERPQKKRLKNKLHSMT